MISPRPISRRLLATVAALALITATLAGCSDDDDGDPGASTPTVDSTAEVDGDEATSSAGDGSAPSDVDETGTSGDDPGATAGSEADPTGGDGDSTGEDGAGEDGSQATPTPLATPTVGPEGTGSDGDAAEPGGGGGGGAGGAPGDRPVVPAGEQLVVEVIEQRPHDPTAFTQGLEFHEGRLFESRGLYGESALTEIDPADGSVLRRVDLPAEVFGEGLTVVGDRIIVLTWREQVAPVFDLETFEQVDEFTYEGEGWGLCLDEGADRLLMSDGTPTLTHRDPDTFEVLETVEVRLQGRLVADINELECVDGLVWANIWRTDQLVVIDPDTGQVLSVVQAPGLLSAAEAQDADVLNGIARDPDIGTWLITGKWWPSMFVVDFVTP